MTLPSRPRLHGPLALACTAALLTGTACSPEPEAPQDPGSAEERSSSPGSSSASASATASATPLPPSEGVLRIGIPAERPGLSVREGDADPSGVDVETARTVAEYLGFEDDQISWRTVPADDLAAALAAGRVDVAIGGLAVADGDGTSVDVAGPSLALRHDLLVGAAAGVAGPADLAGRTVCAVEGSAAMAAITPLLPADAEMLTQQSTGECLTALLSGRVAAVAGDEPELAALARSEEAGDAVGLVGAPYGTTAYGVGLPEGSTLCSAVTAALETRFRDGAWQESAADLADATGIGLDTELEAASRPDAARCG